MDALHRPAGRPRRERHTSDTPVGQPGNLVMPDEGLPDRENIVVADASLTDNYADELKFMEEPVTIMVNKSPEKFAPLTVDCWVNGKGVEIWDRSNKWIETGWVPVEMPVTIKRKYVEVLARTKHMSVRTEVQQMADGERNEIQRSNSLKAQFSVLHDPNPKGAYWLQRIISERF